MSVEENKAIVRLVFEEALNRGNLDIIDALFAADFVDRSTPDQTPGPGGVKAYFTAVRSGFPDIHVTIDDLIAEGARVVVRTTWRGTHRGIYEGSSPSGQQVTRTMIQIFTAANGKIVEEWNEGASLLP